jgi:hypothetical protein
MPYRTMDDRIDGVVITFANITEAKRLEAMLRGQHASLQKHLHQPSAPAGKTSRKRVPTTAPSRHRRKPAPSRRSRPT